MFALIALVLTSRCFRNSFPSCRTFQLSDFSPDQLMLSLGLRSILRTRGLDPQENASLKKTLPSFLHHASVVRLGKTQVVICAQGDLVTGLSSVVKENLRYSTARWLICVLFFSHIQESTSCHTVTVPGFFLQGLIHPLKQSAAVFPKVHTVWKVLWDDIGLAPAGQPRSSLTPKRLQRLGEVRQVALEYIS